MGNAGVFHLDLDTFFVSVERLLDPKLRDRPVVVGGNPFGRGVVAGCSYEARAYGIHSAQPIRRAYRLCPQAVFLHGSYIHYAEYSKLVGEILRELAPVCEAASIDEFYLDLSATERLKGDTYRWAQEIQRTVHGETALPIRTKPLRARRRATSQATIPPREEPTIVAPSGMEHSATTWAAISAIEPAPRYSGQSKKLAPANRRHAGALYMP